MEGDMADEEAGGEFLALLGGANMQLEPAGREAWFTCAGDEGPEWWAGLPVWVVGQCK